MAVRLIGDLRSIASASLKGTVPLRDLISQPHVWGLGMPDGLNAEILILDSHCYIGRFDKLSYLLSEVPSNVTVAFLATATVASWKNLPIPESVTSFKELEAFISSVAGSHPPGHLLPFRVQGKVKGLRWMVVGGEGNGAPTPRESFIRQRMLGGLDDAILEDSFGIYSAEHRGTATNPNSSVHLHFKTHISEQLFVGHLDDDFMLAPGALLLVPGP